MKLRRFDRIVIGAVLALIVVAGGTALIATRQGERIPRIAYLAPSSGPFNLSIADPTTLDTEQITFSQTGVYDFAISPDGRYIAYSEDQADLRTREIMLFDLADNSTRALTNCRTENAVCDHPVWRPDSIVLADSVLAYQRRELNDTMGSVSRIWLLEFANTSTFPLFEQVEVLGADPQWSPDGTRLAFYDLSTQGVLIYNFNAASEQTRLQALEFGNGSSGVFSPDSAHLIYPQLTITTPTRSMMRIANLDTGGFRSLTSDDDLTEDRFADWHSDGRRVAITRKYLDERYTEGDQVYLVDTETGGFQPLIFDENYQHSAVVWEGDQLAVHRYSYGSGLPEIWVYDLTTQVLSRVVEDGFYPRWLR